MHASNLRRLPCPSAEQPAGKAARHLRGTDRAADPPLPLIPTPPSLPPSLLMQVWRINLDAGEGQTVDLSGKGETWWEQSELTKLMAASNSISSIPDEVANLVCLTLLDLHDNAIVAVSPALAELVRDKDSVTEIQQQASFCTTIHADRARFVFLSLPLSQDCRS